MRDTIARYHESNRVVWREKMEMGRVFNRERNKIRKLLLMCGRSDSENAVESYFKPDAFGDGYAGTYL